MKAFGSFLAITTTSLLTRSTRSVAPCIAPAREIATTSRLFTAAVSDDEDKSMTTTNNSAIAASSHNEYPVRTMLRGWLSLMVPMAWVTWRHTSSMPMTIGAFLAGPVFAILQGTIGILRFRVLYGDAPLPLSPAHGVVVVNPKNNTAAIAASCRNNKGCSCLGGSRWRNTAQVTEEERQVLAKALKEPPLRVLVIGDSLAIGVGTSRSCTPLLPEIISRTLSKALGGRAVYWTCHGAPGASAGWIVRELERGVGGDDSEVHSEFSETDCDTLSSDSSSSDDDADEDELPTEWQEWRDRLHRHRKRFDPNVFGPYDITVVLTGSNDLKSAFFPFLLTGEDVEFRQQAKQRGGGYDYELRRVLDTLRHRMKEGMNEIRDIRDSIMERLQPISPRATKSHKHADNSQDEKEDKTSKDSPSQHPKDEKRHMVVLPGMPARALPVFRMIPLRWLAVPIVAIMDNHKRALAKSHPDEVIFVEAPTVAGITEFEEQRGPIWEQRVTEDTLLALRDIRKSTCTRIESDMQEYYSKVGQKYEYKKVEGSSEAMPQHNAPVPPLSERPGQPGSKIFSVDKVHPNDEGYDYWGRYIGDAIVKAWKTQKHQQ